MAGKVRDYKAEYARRTALAKARGRRSYGAERYAIEHGWIKPVAPHRIKHNTAAYQERRLAARKPFGGLAKISRAQRAQDWSDIFSRSESGEYHPENAKELGVTKAAYTTAYLNAWVLGDDRYKNVRHNGGSVPLHDWFVDLNDYMSEDDYDDKYGIPA
jgi:hypothetical protein